MKKPASGTYPPYYQAYIDKVKEEDTIKALEAGLESAILFFESLPLEKEDYRYAEGKWSVKEVFGHIIDSERVFAYRAMCIARGEAAGLPGFEENDYVANGNFSSRSMQSLLDEYVGLRRSNITLFKSFNEEQSARIGMANNKPVQVRAIVAIIAGHEQHHIGVIRDRYLSKQPVSAQN